MRHSSSTIKPIVVCLFIPLVIGMSGCATNPKPYAPAFPALSETDRENLGTVGIASAGFVPKAEIRKPMGKGAGAATGARIGAVETLVAGLESQDPLGLLIGIALAPVGAVVGCIYGTVEGVTSKQRRRAEKAINKAISDLKIQATMGNYVLQAARLQTVGRVVLLDGQGPKTPEGKVDYSFLSNKGVDTVLEITVPDFGLMAEKGINPPLAFFMDLTATLIRTKDGSVLYTRKLKYRSARLKFTKWAATGAKPLKDAFDRCYRSLAEKIVEEVFLLYTLPLNPAPHA